MAAKFPKRLLYHWQKCMFYRYRSDIDEFLCQFWIISIKSETNVFSYLHLKQKYLKLWKYSHNVQLRIWTLTFVMWKLELTQMTFTWLKLVLKSGWISCILSILQMKRMNEMSNFAFGCPHCIFMLILTYMTLRPWFTGSCFYSISRNGSFNHYHCSYLIYL